VIKRNTFEYENEIRALNIFLLESCHGHYILVKQEKRKDFSFQQHVVNPSDMIDGRKNYVSAQLDILIEMVTVHHIQSLDLKKFYVSRDKEWLRKEPYKMGSLCFYNSKRSPYVNAAILFCPCFWHNTQLISTLPKALSSSWTGLVIPTRCLTK
jgi:hypothetical protein